MKSALMLATLAFLGLSAASPIKREDKNIEFGIISLHSGSQFHFNSIKKVDSHVQVFAVGGDEGKDVTLTLKPDGSLFDQDGTGIYVNPDTGEFGDVDPWGSQKPSEGFEIQEQGLAYNGKQNWRACPSGENKYSLANNDCEGGTGIMLYVVKPHEV